MDCSFGLPGSGCYWCPLPSICAKCAAWLPCNSARSAGRTLLSLLRFHCGTKGFALCGVYHPLHHFGTILRCFALPHWGIHLWCSRTPKGRSVRRLRTLSGSCVPFLPLSVAASWPLLLLLRCWVSLCLWVKQKWIKGSGGGGREEGGGW